MKNKDDELKSLHDKILKLNQTIESLQLSFNKEEAERQRICVELSKVNNLSKIWNSERSALERQVSHLLFYAFSK